MAINKNTISKIATVFGYCVYVVTIIIGLYLIYTDPKILMQAKPTMIQIGGLLLVCYGIVQCAVTFYNRLPPLEVKTSAQVALAKSKIREINDRKSKERKNGN